MMQNLLEKCQTVAWRARPTFGEEIGNIISEFLRPESTFRNAVVSKQEFTFARTCSRWACREPDGQAVLGDRHVVSQSRPATPVTGVCALSLAGTPRVAVAHGSSTLTVWKLSDSRPEFIVPLWEAGLPSGLVDELPLALHAVGNTRVLVVWRLALQLWVFPEETNIHAASVLTRLTFPDELVKLEPIPDTSGRFIMDTSRRTCLVIIQEEEVCLIPLFLEGQTCRNLAMVVNYKWINRIQPDGSHVVQSVNAPIYFYGSSMVGLDDTVAPFRLVIPSDYGVCVLPHWVVTIQNASHDIACWSFHASTPCLLHRMRVEPSLNHPDELRMAVVHPTHVLFHGSSPEIATVVNVDLPSPMRCLFLADRKSTMNESQLRHECVRLANLNPPTVLSPHRVILHGLGGIVAELDLQNGTCIQAPTKEDPTRFGLIPKTLPLPDLNAVFVVWNDCWEIVV